MSKKQKHGAPVETWPRDIPCMREDCAPGLDAEGRGVWAPEYAVEQDEEHLPVSCETRAWAPWGTGFTVRDPSPSACPRPVPAPGTWRHPETRAALRVRIAENAREARADLEPGEQMELL